MMRVAVDYPFHCETGCPLGRIHWSGPYVRSPGQPMHRVVDFTLVYVCRGVCEYTDGSGRKKRLGIGDMMVNVPGTCCGYHAPPGEEWDEHYISSSGPIVEMWQQRGILDLKKPFWRLMPVDYWVARMVAVIGENPTPDADESLAQLGRLQVLLADMRMAQREGVSDPESRRWLDRARKLLNVSGMRLRPSLEEVAEAMECDYHTFRRRFTRLSGMAPSHYRMQTQIELARSMMFRNPDFGNKQLADACGFSDEYHFSRKFKHATGWTPSEYRRRMRR